MTEDAYITGVLKRYTSLPPLAPAPAIRTVRAIIPRLRFWADRWLARPISLSGSYAKGTAIAGTTDIDLFISLKPQLSLSLKDIYWHLFRFAEDEGWHPRAQNVSVGIEYGGYKIDLIPAKVQTGLRVWHSLYVRKQDTWTQTNIDLHIRKVRASRRLREIRALKIWRMLHEIDFPSFYLELTIIAALAGRDTTSLGRNVMHALKYISTKLPATRVIDPANTSNIVSNDLSATEKRLIALQAQHSSNESYWERILW